MCLAPQCSVRGPGSRTRARVRLARFPNPAYAGVAGGWDIPRRAIEFQSSMDNLTHTLTGIVLSRAGFNRVVPRASLLLALASNAPDLDIIAGLDGSLAYLHHHRGWTHAFAFAPIVALAPLPIWFWLNRKNQPGSRQLLVAWLLSIAGVVAHHLMDWLNVYGIRLLLPFRWDWLRLDLLYIVDAWVWLILLMAMIAPALTRLVYGEMGAKAGSGRGAAWAAILLLGFYFGLRWETHGRAVGQLESRLYGGMPPLQVAAVPGPINPLRWTGLVETARAWHVLEVDLTRPFDSESGETFYRPGLTRAVASVRQTHTARQFLDFARFPVWRVVPSAEGAGVEEVTIHDIRFGSPDEMRFTARFVVQPDGRVTREEFLFGSMGGGRR